MAKKYKKRFVCKGCGRLFASEPEKLCRRCTIAATPTLMAKEAAQAERERRILAVFKGCDDDTLDSMLRVAMAVYVANLHERLRDASTLPAPMVAGLIEELYRTSGLAN